jgi:hypothetical protein
MRWLSVAKLLNRFDTVSSGAGENARLMYVNSGSDAFHPSSFRRNWMTAWNRFDAVIL